MVIDGCGVHIGTRPTVRNDAATFSSLTAVLNRGLDCRLGIAGEGGLLEIQVVMAEDAVVARGSV